MRYLLIDTATHDLTIAISSDTEVIKMATSNNANEHSKYALVELESIFNQAHLKPSDIDKVLVVNGPGSFTGVRIGVTIAKTYAWALKKDIIPVSSLLAHALSYEGYDYYVSVLDARREAVYAAVYDKQYNSILDEQYITIDKLYDFISVLKGNVVVIGDVDIKNYKHEAIKVDVLKVINHYKDGQPVSAHSLNPRYLKLVEAEEKLMEAGKW